MILPISSAGTPFPDGYVEYTSKKYFDAAPYNASLKQIEPNLLRKNLRFT
jgi:hypothetical protein